MDQNSWASPRVRRDCWVKLASNVRNNTFQPTVDLILEACFTYTLKGKLHPELKISAIIYFLSQQCKFGGNLSHKCTRALTKRSLSRRTTRGCNSNRVKSWPHFVYFEREEVSIPSVWLSVTTANITEVEICPGSRTDVFISSPVREVPRPHLPHILLSRTQTHANTSKHANAWTDRQTASYLGSSVCPCNALGSFVSWQAEKTIYGDRESNT